jgi:hypothetical protein
MHYINIQTKTIESILTFIKNNIEKIENKNIHILIRKKKS